MLKCIMPPQSEADYFEDINQDIYNLNASIELIPIRGIYVGQGNGNFKSIREGDNRILYTSHLGPCVAIIIHDRISGLKQGRIHLIHSDSNGKFGKEQITLAETFSALGLAHGLNTTIALVGALDKEGINAKMNFIKKLLPLAKFAIKLNAEGAYVNGFTGEITTSKKAFRLFKLLPDRTDPDYYLF